MTSKAGYIGVDIFRIIASLLVIAIHTSPFLLFGEVPNFIFTRVIGRLAVPFFLVATGFFVFGQWSRHAFLSGYKIWKFLVKTGKIYLISVIIYLPVNFYAGHINGGTTAFSFLKMFFIDGTMYHLWYLPAVMLGVLLVWLFLRFKSSSLIFATAIAVLLYLIGLLGDSYYGFISTIPTISHFYGKVFLVSSFTRNGLFYAPIFLLLGVWAAKLNRKISRPVAGALFFMLAGLMAIEALLLLKLNVQRHDSMYLFLPLCTFALFIFLKNFTGPSSEVLRDISLALYIVHPLVIVCLRGTVKVFRLPGLLVENSLVYYLLVCAGSFAAAVLFAHFEKSYRNKTLAYKTGRAWLEISLTAMEHNVSLLRSMVPPTCRLMPAVKANAYGLGAVTICQKLNSLGIDAFCVASAEEGVALRKAGIRGEILVLGYTHPNNVTLLKKYKLTQTLVDFEYANLLAKSKKKLPVHIKIDSGMHRLGERQENIEKIKQIFLLPTHTITGVFTQLASCDSTNAEDIAYTQTQIERFDALLAELKESGIALVNPHVQCSYGILNYPELSYAFARPGLALYGVVDEALCVQAAPALQPIFEVKARVALVKTVYRNERIGYGQNFIAENTMKIAVVTIGYADGFPRSQSCGVGCMLINGNTVPVVGNVCMDQTIVDVTNAANVKAGDIAVIIGASENVTIPIQQFARQANTIPNEIMSRLGQRLTPTYL